MCSTSCILRFAATLISVIDSEAFFEIQRLFIIFCTSSAISSQDWSLIILAEVELINPLTMAFSIMFVMSCVYCVIYFLHYPERERERVLHGTPCREDMLLHRSCSVHIYVVIYLFIPST
jgi:hypothetical protein